MEPESEGLRELKKEVYTLLLKKFSDITREDNFLERFNAINQKMREKYGCVITGILVGIMIETSQPGSETASVDQGVSKLSTPRVFIGPEDKEFLAVLKISLTNEDLGELKRNFYSARMESITGNSQKMIAGSQVPDMDPRTKGQIINNIRSVAQKLDLISRLAVAKRINIEMGMYIPIANQSALQNDTFWLQQIQTAVERIQGLAGAEDKIKALLFSLEVIVKSGGAEA